MRIETCPSCGAGALEHVVSPVTFEVDGKPKTIPEVPHWKCTSCGEELFDRESNQMLDPHRQRKGSKSAA